MALPALDPHPFGCPLCVANTPSQMTEVITQIVLKLRDLLFPSVHVINPSKGASYPILNLHVDEDDKPRLVIFPGWEDNRESARRRLNYGRQMTLLRRIHEAGVRGERMEEWRGEPITGLSEEPVHLALAVPAPRMRDIAHDLYDYLGDQLRITVTSLPQPQGRDLPIIKLYAPTQERRPRIVLFPGWTTPAESPRDRLGPDEMAALYARLEAERLPELPAEALR